ncbi:MAG TPA: phage tail protein [Symbiobacteriaceae bacterium]|nr:phage tail protein [Symbiobacteriaceae bacterium]
MPEQDETIAAPFATFNFKVEITLEGSSSLVCSAAFAEVDGLEVSMQPKTIREGGNNAQPIHLLGPVQYGQLTLKRGMTANLDLWDWFDRVQAPGGGSLRGNGEVVLLGRDHETPLYRFALTRCLPVKVKAPALNAKEGLVAIEEMQLVYEKLSLVRS